MELPVVLDCDWFTIGKNRHLKKLVFVCPANNLSKEYTFSLPSTAKSCRQHLAREAWHSHGLLWSVRGLYRDDQVPAAFDDIFNLLQRRPVQLKFLAKGLEKCRLLESWLPDVSNLEDLECPRFEDLTKLDKTTANKAQVYAMWYKSWLHQ